MFYYKHPTELTSKCRQAGFKWNGSTIMIESRFIARYFFLATQVYLYVNGQLIAEGGGFKI